MASFREWASRLLSPPPSKTPDAVALETDEAAKPASLSMEQKIARLQEIEGELTVIQQQYNRYNNLCTHHWHEMNKLRNERLDLVKSMGIRIPDYDPSRSR